MAKIMSIILALYSIVAIFTVVCNATLSKSDRKSLKYEKKSPKTDLHSTSDASTKNSFLKKAVNYEEIIEEHKSFSVSQSLVRHFDQEVLAYVTPWNNHGYDIAKIFAAKFTMICPVWLQMKPKDSKGGILVEGMHDVDTKWMSTLRQLNKNIKIVPRIILEHWTYPTFKKLLIEGTSADIVSTELVNLAKTKNFDGYVMEIWSLLGGQMKVELTKFLIKVSTTLRKYRLDFILVIPPPSYAGGQIGMFVRQDFENLADYITAFSLMSYDYSSPQRPGPNSPLRWLLQCVEDLIPDKSSQNRRKLLLGVNFYGNDYSSVSGKPVIGHEAIHRANENGTFCEVDLKYRPVYHNS